jgi:RNA polymerase sigma-70 factor (ECF subfamily)
MLSANKTRKSVIDEKIHDDVKSSSDEQLLKQMDNCNSSGKEANEFITRHYSWVHRICTMRLGCSADAQDVSQEVFMRVQKYARQFENRSAVRTWLFRIAQNQCNSYAAKFKHQAFENIEDYADLLVDTNTARTNITDELVEQVQHAMSEIPEPCKNIIELRFFHELTLEEISNRLNIGLSATKMRLYRALDQLRTAYV